MQKVIVDEQVVNNLTAREERIAQNAYWICDAMTVSFKEKPSEHLDSYFNTHSQDDWVARTAIEFENQWNEDDYSMDYTEEVYNFTKRELEKLKEEAYV